MKRLESKPVTGPFGLQLSRFTDNRGPGGWRLCVTEQQSGIQFLEMHLTHEQFSEMVGAVYISDAQGELFVNNRIGLKHECKSVDVPFDRVAYDYTKAGWEKFAVFAREYAAEHHPGWELSDYDLKEHNGHRNNGKVYSISLHRWLPVDELTGGVR